MLTLIDEYTRQCLAIHPARSLKSEDVLEVVKEAVREHGAPDYLRSDNGLLSYDEEGASFKLLPSRPLLKVKPFDVEQVSAGAGVDQIDVVVTAGSAQVATHRCPSRPTAGRCDRGGSDQRSGGAVEMDGNITAHAGILIGRTTVGHPRFKASDAVEIDVVVFRVRTVGDIAD